MGTYLNPTLSSRMTRTLTPFLIFQRKLQNLRADEGLGPRFSRRKEPSPDRIGSTAVSYTHLTLPTIYSV